MGDGSFGGSFRREGREGGLVMDFYVLLSIGWDSREGRFSSYFFSCFLPPFFSFLFFHFCLFSFPGEIRLPPP